jgi:Fe-Mn family superoxide dismutase
VVTTHDAASPLQEGHRPLLCCDLWEHAYYLDHQNDREGFLRDFLSRLANWHFAAERYDQKAAA